MVHRYFSIAVALASILANSAEGSEVKTLRIPKEETTTDKRGGGDWDWDKYGMGVERGIGCKAGVDKKKMRAGRQCEGGIKKVESITMGSKGLAETVSTEIKDMASGMVFDKDSIIVPNEIMEQLMTWDVEDEDELEGIFEDEDCSDEEGCGKTIKFGGYAKLFWGCNMTFHKKDDKFTKKIECGGKSWEGAGAKENTYNELKDKEF